MSRALALVKRPAAGDMEFWLPTTLDALGKDEEFLEDTIAAAPELLRMENRSTGIHGPYAAFRQLEFLTPQDRIIRPDIVLLAASGNVIVVEVKLYANPELRDRRVVAQVVDYAAALTALTAEDVGQRFGAREGTQRAWTDRVRALFPAEHDPEELARVVLDHLRTGEINLVVACDKAPAGLQEMLRGVSSQASLDFSLDLVEIEPHVREGQCDILFVPRTRLMTEVVGRTVVKVTYQQGDAKPLVAVATSTVDEIEQKMQDAQKEAQEGRHNLSWEELKAHAEEHQVLPLYERVLSNLHPLFAGANRTQSNLALVGMVDGSRCAILGVYPDASSSARGIAIMVYVDRLAQFFAIPEEEVRRFLGVAPGDTDTWWPESTWFFSEKRLDDLVRFLSKGRQK